MKLKIKAGTTSRIIRILVKDSSSAVGGNLAGLLYNTSGLTAYYSRVGSNGSTQISLVNATIGTYTSGGFIAVDGTNMTGVYELHIPDAALAVGSTAVHIVLQGAANMVPVAIEIELDAFDYQTSIPDLVWNAPPSGYLTNNTMGSGINKLIGDIYFADIKVVNGSPVPNNEYGVSWFKNSFVVNSGQITNPAVSVYSTVDGSTLFQNKVMSFTSFGSLSYIEPTNRMASGIPYLVVTSGVIDNNVQVWRGVKGLDYM